MSDAFAPQNIGGRIAEQDMAKLALQGVEFEKTLGEIAQQPTKRRLDEAHARLYESQAAEHETNLQQTKRMAEIFAAMQGAGTGGETDPASVLDKMAQAAAGAGQLTKAMGFMKQADASRGTQASVIARQARAQKDALAAERMDLEMQENFLGEATDQGSWERANMLYMAQTGRPSAYVNEPFSPELVGQLRNSVVSRKDQILLEEKRLENESRKQFREGRLAQGETLTDIRERELQLRRDREARLEKAGGKVNNKAVGTPTNGELEAASTLIKRDFDNLSSEDRKDAAYAVASRARELRRNNPALNPDTARQMALSEAVKAGDLLKEKGFFGREASKFLGRGKSPQTAGPLPDRSKLAAGRYYITARGPAKYLGDGKFAAVAPEPKDDDSDDEDEDD